MNAACAVNPTCWDCCARSPEMSPRKTVAIARIAKCLRLFLRAFILRFVVERLISKRLAGLQSVRDALLCFAFAAKRDEGFALEIEDVLLADKLRRT